MTLEDSPLKESNEDEKTNEKGGTTELSSLSGDTKNNADVQADSIQISEKTESDSSTSVETEQSDE